MTGALARAVPAAAAPLRILTLSTLYPNREQPGFGVFVETRLRHLVASGEAVSTVVAPVPWFPIASDRFGRYGTLARVPRLEVRHGLEVLHPRFPVVPKVGTAVSPFLLCASLLPVLRRMIRSGQDFDVIDAHYFYPDGVAAAMLGQALGRPVVVTARGSDINIIPAHPVARRLIRWAAEQADGLVAVSQALRHAMAGLGIDTGRVQVLRNGVELETFRPMDRATARQRLGIAGPVLLSAGNLVPLKGHDLVIGALPALPDATLLIAGRGPEEGALRRLAADLGVAGRVRFLGAVPHADMPALYGAADALVLASSHEGWANVLLEAMACGTPVVASRAGSAPELITEPAAGCLLPERSAAAIAHGVRSLLDAPPPQAATRRFAERFGWDETTCGQIDLFRSILSRRRT